MKEEIEEAFQNALRDINSGKMSQAAAAKVYGIPSSTLNDRINGTSSSFNRGSPPILSVATEATIVFMIKRLKT